MLEEAKDVGCKTKIVEFETFNFPYYNKQENNQSQIDDWLIPITEIVQGRHPFLQTIFEEFIHPKFHHYCMKVEVPNVGLLSHN